MKAAWIAISASALTLVTVTSASAQVLVEEGYGPPVYEYGTAPIYSAPVLVAPRRRVYVEPAPVYRRVVREYAAPVHRRIIRETIVSEPGPGWATASFYPEW